MCIVHSTSMTNSTIVVTDNTAKLGITLPKSIVQKIDKKRADIPRSRYILVGQSKKGILPLVIKT
jgi:hypothetical protein